MRSYKIYGYMFDCNEFKYNNRHITGMCCAVQIHQTISNKKFKKELDLVAVQITKADGFIILLNSKAQNIVVQPYKIYFLAMCENYEEELIEVDNKTLKKYSNYIIEDINSSAEATWTID